MTKSDQEIFELLRQKRNALAEGLGIKPFMVFHNKTLQEASRVRPPTIEKLLEIKGIGQKKAEKYGQIILEVVNSLTHKPKVEKEVPEKVFSVAEFIRDLNVILIQKRALVLGEIGQVNPRNGYFFFRLKDKKEEATLNCFVRRYQLENFGVDLRDGLEIKVSGVPRVHERTGSLTFDVEHIGLVGEGALKHAFEKLKKDLEKQGYFAPERKRPIPKFVDSIGLITSQFADAKTDFLEHLGKFGFKIYFQDVRVEGIYAVDEIASAIKYFNESVSDIDVLVLTRGGGGLESLQAFNSGDVAKAIHGSKVPVITGIGHEADVTVADLTADLRASTPTHAARILSDPWRQAVREIATMQRDIIESFDKTLSGSQTDLENFKDEILESVGHILDTSKEKLETLKQDLTIAFEAKLRMTRSLLKEQKEKLELASPLKRLKQGYSIVMLGDKLVRSVGQLKIGDIISIKLFRGKVLSQVKGVHNGERK